MTIRFEYWLHYDYDSGDNEFYASEKLEKGSLTLKELTKMCDGMMTIWYRDNRSIAPRYAVEVLVYTDQLFADPMRIHWHCVGCAVKRELYMGG